jgi:hypothetical protein
MKQMIISIVAGIILLLGCKKDKTPVDTKLYFENSFLTHFESFKVFTKNGQINNAALAQNYSNEFSTYFFNTTSSYADPVFQKFEVVDEDSIINISSNIAIGAKRKNTDTYDRFVSNFTELVNDTNALNMHIIQYKVLERKITSSGLVYYEIQKPVYFAKKINDTLFFPIVRYITISRRPFITTFSTGKINNVFSTDGLAKLDQYDTLVVQSFDLAMKRVK